MTDPLDDDLRELLARRTRVRPEDLAPLRHAIATLPPRRRSRRGLLAAAAGIVLLLGFGGLLVARLPLGTSGAAPGPPDPAAFAGDPRLGECGVTSAGAVAIFELAHVRDYPRQLPAAYELKGLEADPEAPALVVVLDGPGSPDRMGSPAPEGSHDLCLVIGADAATWTVTRVAGVDTSGLLAFLPEPTGTPIAERLVPWVERCGGSAAGIAAVVDVPPGTEAASKVVLLPEPPELATSGPATIVVYTSTHPFPPLGTPPAAGATIEPRDPLAEGHHDVCVLVGGDAATAARSVHEDVLVRFVVMVDPSASIAPGPTPDVAPSPTLPPQLAASECAAMRFATDRCLAVVEAALEALDGWWIGVDFGWASIERVTLEPISEITFGGRNVATVVFVMVDGTTYTHDVRCGGISFYSLVCTDRPEILVTGPDGPRSFEVLVDADAHVQPLPVRVDDETGMVSDVVGLDAAARRGLLDGVSNPPGQASVLLVRWLGAICDEHVTLTLTRTAEGFRIREQSTWPTDDCELAGHPRAIAIRLNAPILADSVSFETVVHTVPGE
ncbi:MAG: hypothetical protein AB1627_05700 [Chloroflexota bacterium]